MKNRKEIIKSVILIVLVSSSLFLSYLISTYSPDYEIFSKKTTNKVIDNKKKQEDTFKIFTPEIAVKFREDVREEVVIPNTITKVARVPGIKNRDVMKSMISLISEKTSEEVRVRNDNINQILDKSKEYISFCYNSAIDTGLIKTLLFSNEQSNISLLFDNIVITKENPDTIYLYKEGVDSYLQINLEDKVYESISDIFEKNKVYYGKYSLNNKFIYLKDEEEKYSLDIYGSENINLNTLGKNLFQEQGNFKSNSSTEITDGYALLRKEGNEIVYVNPSNEENKGKITSEISSLYATEFLLLNFIYDVDYIPIKITNGYTEFQQVYKDGLVFSKIQNTNKNVLDGSESEIYYKSNLEIYSNENGVYKALGPSKIPKIWISSQELGMYDVERVEVIINYLYNNFKLSDIGDIELGYEKSYDEKSNTFTYKPKWYIMYKDNYIGFKELQEKLKTGGI